MAFARVRAHGAAVGAIAVVALAGTSVVSLALAEGRLQRFDLDRPTSAASSRSVSARPAAAPPPSAPPPSAPLSSATTVATVAPGPPAGLLRDLFTAINADREANGLTPLAWDDRLRSAAQQSCDAMAASGLVARPDVDALLALGFTRVGQTVLTAPHDVTAVSAEQGWMGSAPQRATILDPALRAVGIGASTSADGRIWIAADFGATP